jgi:cell division protein ZapA
MAILSIKVRIGDREYPMKVEESDEEMVRNAAKLLNDKIKTYREQFGIEDRQDLLAMVAFDSMVEQMKSDRSKSEIEGMVSEKISYLANTIHKALAD